MNRNRFQYLEKNRFWSLRSLLRGNSWMNWAQIMSECTQIVISGLSISWNFVLEIVSALMRRIEFRENHKSQFKRFNWKIKIQKTSKYWSHEDVHHVDSNWTSTQYKSFMIRNTWLKNRYRCVRKSEMVQKWSERNIWQDESEVIHKSDM